MFIGRYRQIRRLSGGASGEVYLVEDVSKRSRHALKLLPERVASHRLRGEFARLTELSHPSIVRVLDAGVLTTGSLAGRAFLVMDFVAGETLAESIASSAPAESRGSQAGFAGRDPSREGLETLSGFPSQRFEQFAKAAEALADALAYLHGQGVIHGDISPANIRCDESGRPILIDFGLAQHWHATGELASSAVSGTLGFIAPEALLGERVPASDLFALGATLYDAWTGTPPFGLGMEAVKQIWQGQPSTPSSLHPGLPLAWDQLLLGLIAADVEDRPSSARETLQSIRRELPGSTVSVESDLAVPFPAGDPLVGVVVGRSDEQAILRRHFEQLAEGASTVSVVCIVGAPGSGRHTLIRRVLREARLAILSQSLQPFAIEESEYTELLGPSQTSRDEGASLPLQEPGSKAQSNLARVAGELEARAEIRPLCLALAGSPEDEALAQAIASGSPSGRLLVLLPCEREIERRGSVSIRPSPLSRAAIGELARRGAGCEAPREILDEIVAASAGLAGASALLVRSWIARLRGGQPQVGALAESDLDMARLLDASFAALTKAARARVLAIALSAGTGETTEAEDGGEAEAEARSAGWVLADGARLPSELHLSAVFRALAQDADLQKSGRKLLDALPEADAGRAEVLLAIGERGRAAAGFRLAMRAALAKTAWSKVAAYGLRARAADPAGGTREEMLALATALGILGRYDEALALLSGGDTPGEPADLANLVERKAWLLGRRGDPEAARGILETALLGMAPDGEGASLLRARLARMLVASGRFDEALVSAEPAFGAPAGVGMAARESAVLALAYSGKLEAARRLLDTLTSDARATKDRSLTARVIALDGLVEQLLGRPAQAARAYEQAVREYEQIQDLHGAAAAAFNLGCVLAETGDYAGSIEALERAIRELGRLGAVTDHALAVFNVGQLFLELGDLDAAARAVESLQEDARMSRVEAFQGHAWLLTAQVQRKRGFLRDAAASYHAAAEIFSRLGMQAMGELADLERAESLAQQAELIEAWAILATAERGGHGAAQGAGAPSSLPRDESLACARARIALSDPASTGAETVALAESLAKRAGEAQKLARLPVAWRLASLAGQLFARANDAREQQALDIARTCFREVKMKTPAKYWPGLESDSEAKVIELRAGDSKSAAGLALRAAVLESRLRRLLRINKRLNSDLRLSRVLETIIDTVIELTDAERGFLLLKDSDGELVVKVARNMDQTTLDGTGSSLSRSIAKQAADSGEPVVAVDAAGDSRFSELLSVSDLHLRSVLAVPLAVKGQVVGTIYVDHRLRKGVFGDDELAMVLDFADQGAIAIENARVVSELRRREQQVQSLNRRLERELKVQEAALSDARVELKESRQAAALRYDYRQIVGQSPCMLDLFRLLDRVTDTSLPVVIEGESGTGKELVARAIHFHGPRKERAFVSENCAAIPETLLESALFGHVRGAFTGADRETRGLFAIANGGTLFLDEVAEMSPAMQGKLLRVLQDGEFHRVGGGERPEKVDVRVLVATNKNLTDMVESGKFRKDLFYRLSVVRLHLPPLRERREDIPLLLRHFLEKAAQQAGTAAKTIDPTAVAKLCRYGWPGNVRELENEIARAAAFAGSAIGISDLSPHIQTGQDPSETIRNEPDSLRIRHRVERLERQLIREAMSRSQGNQTKASTLLGLSRFGLQKKLRRYNLGA
jgi:transcriptional regulator with GAF, ATPase, and Fis domain/serine/threonine protein kinase/predicted negative regulator of RcsB-dependent stress response